MATRILQETSGKYPLNLPKNSIKSRGWEKGCKIDIDDSVDDILILRRG